MKWKANCRKNSERNEAREHTPGLALTSKKNSVCGKKRTITKTKSKHTASITAAGCDLGGCWKRSFSERKTTDQLFFLSHWDKQVEDDCRGTGWNLFERQTVGDIVTDHATEWKIKTEVQNERDRTRFCFFLGVENDLEISQSVNHFIIFFFHCIYLGWAPGCIRRRTTEFHLRREEKSWTYFRGERELILFHY